jgi:hypothetical protein
MFRSVIVSLVLMVVACLPLATATPAAAQGAPCDLVGNSQIIYDQFDIENTQITVDYCGFNTLDYTSWGLVPPSDGFGYFELVVRYDSFTGYNAGPYQIYVANCNGYLSAPNWVFLELSPYDDVESWDFLQQQGIYTLHPGASLQALLFFEISETATVAHTYFINIDMSSQDMQLIDLTLDGGFGGIADAPGANLQMAANALPGARLRGCRAH